MGNLLVINIAILKRLYLTNSIFQVRKCDICQKYSILNIDINHEHYRRDRYNNFYHIHPNDPNNWSCFLTKSIL